MAANSNPYVSRLEFFPLSIHYTHTERSSQVDRAGVSDIIVKATSSEGVVGWGESCSGANLASVLEALKAMEPFVIGSSPWESERIRADLWHKGLWGFRKGTASFAYAGIDMALWDICGKTVNQPLYRLLGGLLRGHASYFYYLAWGDAEDLANQCAQGWGKGYRVFYLKVGKDIAAERQMVDQVRASLPDGAALRIDANASWRVAEAIRNLSLLGAPNIDFVEQPVPPDPIDNMKEVRARGGVAICANEGLYSAEDTYRQITNRTADIYCFSPYWVGSLLEFQRLSRVAAFEGLQVCKHTHGEFGIAAAASHHVLLTLPNIVEGNQQTAQVMSDDILTTRLPIADGPIWGTPEGAGLGVDVDEDKLARYYEEYLRHGQILPYKEDVLRQRDLTMGK
jgi:L-alanine-DL-glutamate epimerase-like enolase superfamily enzyme